MVAYEWSSEFKAFTKYCSHCDQYYVGTDNEVESLDLFYGSFGKGQNFGDGLQALCKKCAKIRRRERNGVGNHDEEVLFTAQNGGCALCGIGLFMPHRFNGDPLGAKVDHDHVTGKVRGLLCSPCNLSLGLLEGLLKKDADALNTIRKYLGQ